MSKWKEQREAEKQAAQEVEEKVTLEQSEKDFHEIVEESELLKKFKERHEKESKRRQGVTDSRYYFVVCFSNNEQLVEFCDKFKLRSEQLYMDGKEFSKKVGKALDAPDTQFPRYHTAGADYAKRALPIKKQKTAQ